MAFEVGKKPLFSILGKTSFICILQVLFVFKQMVKSQTQLLPIVSQKVLIVYGTGMSRSVSSFFGKSTKQNKNLNDRPWIDSVSSF